MTTGTSDVTVTQDCIARFQDLKLAKKYTYILYKLSEDKTQVVVDKASTSSKYEEFTSDLPDAECRFAVYDLPYEEDGAKRNKITFVSWAPDEVDTKERKPYIVAKNALRKKLVGVMAEIQCEDLPGVSYDSVVEAVRKQREQ
ncbi:actin-binding ADF family protein [Actinoplanes siamensis]|uniref:ADF-H domain-containing protein n=1 Tax=Actinoplanes siamensis TaxID=1223317 RepID=A0A919NEB1_9ACTN|nr:actin depolymerization factor/cofilin-like domain-containing protein [Actinoplanes siamensis]GIF09628.1 hypothetical protein Asi03nite_71660 [Actinoplanes siamensis]